jgi:hypothetical protein
MSFTFLGFDAQYWMLVVVGVIASLFHLLGRIAIGLKRLGAKPHGIPYPYILGSASSRFSSCSAWRDGLRHAA